MRCKQFDWPRYLAPALYLVLVICHAALGVPMKQPHIFPDELAYLGFARHLIGTGYLPEMGTNPFYHFGYSLLIVPAVAVFSDPARTYQAVILANAFLSSALFLALHYTLHTGLRVERRLSLGAAFMSCLYPAFMLQSNFAWAENALIPGYAAFIAAVAALVRGPSIAKSLLIGILAGLLYTIHPRMLPLLPLTALALCALSVRRMTPWAGTAIGISAIGVIFAITALTNDHFRTLGWAPDHQPVTPVSFLGRAASPSRLVGTGLAAGGQVLYLAQSTYGLFLLPPLWLAIVLWNDGGRALAARHGQHKALTAIFVIVCSVALFATSAIAMASGGRRVDHLVYGRYNEVFLPHYLAFALVMLASTHDRMRRVFVPLLAVVVMGGLTAIVVAVRGGELLSRDFVAPNIFGIYSILRMMGRADLVVISLAAAVLCLAVSRAFSRSTVAGLTAVAVVFSASTLYAYPYCLSAQDWIAPRDDVPSRIRELGHVEAVSYDVDLSGDVHKDLSDPRSVRFLSSQYLLPRTRVARFSSRRGERPRCPIVIASATWRDAEKLQARFVVAERNADLALWLLPAANQYDSAALSYMGVALGPRRHPGVWESGFHGTEVDRRGPFRWTNGSARLVVPVNEFPTQLAVRLTTPRPKMRVRILVNGAKVFDGIYSGGRRIFDLTKSPLSEWVTIEVLSDTIVPRRHLPGSSDSRTVGVAVREIRLVG